MKQFSYKISDPAGIHARPAGYIVKEAAKYGSDIKIEVNQKTADAKKIFSVMSLGAKNGDDITVTVSGNDEEKAAERLKKLISEKL